MTNDKLIIAGHEFTSRFILGSNTALSLYRQLLKMPELRLSHWRCDVQILRVMKIF